MKTTYCNRLKESHARKGKQKGKGIEWSQRKYVTVNISKTSNCSWRNECTYINNRRHNTLHMFTQTVTIPERTVYIDNVHFAHRTRDMGVMLRLFAREDRVEKGKATEKERKLYMLC